MSILRTIEKPGKASFKEKNSEFIAQIFHVESEQEVLDYLQSIKKRYYDASHHCFAYKFRDGKFRYSDAGEPNGTAGIRIYNAIEHYGLADILLVVTRYFGGTKLGVGPLGKAYYEASGLVLSQAAIIEKKEFRHCTFSCSYDNMNQVYRILGNHQARNIQTDYAQGVKINCDIEANRASEISKLLIDISNGEIISDISPESIYL
jgi:uncharacterized YigZ family protein